MLEYIILGLASKKELTGYDIKKCIGERFGIFYKASFGSLYPALNRLVAKGYVTSETKDGGRKKVYYKTTAEGLLYFKEWLTSPMEILDGTNPNLIKVYFFDQLPDDEREQQLMQYEMNNVSYLKQLHALRERLSTIEHPESHYYKLSTLYYGIIITQETIHWCRQIRTHQPLPDLLNDK